MDRKNALCLNAGFLPLDLDRKPVYPNAAFESLQGVGMTSQRTRDRLVRRLMDYGIDHPYVLEAIRLVPRHCFLDEAMASRCYDDTALPIGYGQTISQPLVVATMTQWLLGAKTNSSLRKVLEIGTGSGYQTAILALLAEQVYSVERIEPLMQKAHDVLTRLQLQNVWLYTSDGHWGLSDRAPYDCIISAASPERVPEELVAQLKEGGRLVMPVGSQSQQLLGIEKTSTGIQTTDLGEVMFVPMKKGIER